MDLVAATAELGFKHIGSGRGSDGWRVWLVQDDLSLIAIGIGRTIKAAKKAAAEKAYSRYWASRLASEAALADAVSALPRP